VLPNKAMERTVMDKVPAGRAARAASSTLMRQRAAAQRQRYVAGDDRVACQ
jgi:hypothetical protein